ncbi:uncharacterized protein LOC123556306 [Mercenaria mercenaria]|uniref:uncharacterized protein LOC123556306 n=1 Tax=Mercenaria mercenaria TaxID=6596 RepID=UPI00234E5988|nr:uncharacterized protein LOC123556306 [Mercenaria mercenaria]
MDSASVVILCICFALCYAGRELRTYRNSSCIRPCEINQPRECVYEFDLELYFTLTKACYGCPFNTTDCFRPHCIPADGVPRGILVVNRMLPGPAIHVCEGDTVIVNVVNDLAGGEGTSIHWHGILQHGSQHMDGVGMVTQCPIQAETSFEYRFIAENPGSHFWHAHLGMQRTDGIFGAFVVRQADGNEDHLGLYEEDLPEHTIVINDWIGEIGIERYAHYQHSDGDDEPESILVNGKGMYREFVNTVDQTKVYTPVEVFHVTRGKRYRFRVISAATMNCPIQVSVDEHTVTMIASDGGAFEKIDVDSFTIFAGERYDFVLNASMPVDNYWIRLRGLADCGEKKATQVAILRYNGAQSKNPSGTITWEDGDREGKLLNPLNKKANDTYIPVVNLKSLVAGGDALKAVPDKKFYLAMDFNKVDNYYYQHETYYPISATKQSLQTYMPQINRVSLTLPHSPPLYQHEELDENIYCNYETLGSRNCSREFCECVHRLKVDLGDVVEFIIIGESVNIQANHPMHIHGYRFFVVGMDIVGETTSMEEIKQLDNEGRLARNLVDPVAKDTVTVPDGGYTIVRFQANNPGFWFFHCHIQFHLSIGMGLLVQVGEAENMPRVPHDFPRCGNWKFTDKRSDGSENKKCTSGASVFASTQLMILVVATMQTYLSQ